MKTAIIFILSAALLAVAAFTRPDRRTLLLQLADRAEGSWHAGDVDAAVHTVAALEFRNRLLWTDAVRDGRVVYTGVFGHWFARGDDNGKQLPSTADLRKLLGR